jgi:2-iminobutanoate/2-iminopropanoate deaminase
MKKILLLAALLVAGASGAQESVPLSKLPFSAARKAGNTLYVSGQVARDAAGKDVVESVEAETRQVMENLGRILNENGYTFDEVVSATVMSFDNQDR